MSIKNKKIVKQLIEIITKKNFKLYSKYVSENIKWKIVGMPPIIGKNEFIKAVDSLGLENFTTANVKNIISDGDFVVIESSTIINNKPGSFDYPDSCDIYLLKDGKVYYAIGTQENLKQLTQADLRGMIFPRKYGGLNFPFTFYMMAIEMVSRADASLMNIFGLQDIGDTIKKFGNEDQRQKYIPGFCTGEFTGAMALTEPDAGSDLQAVKLQAYQDEKGQWFLKGVKRFITNGNGDVLLVLARSEPGTKDGRGLSMFVCKSDKTVIVRRIEHKLGIHGSPTCELQFNDTPAELVGQRKFGLIKYVLDLMFRARMGVSAQALGISQAAFDEALKYAKAREQFGKSIYNIPVIANMLIDMRVMLEANRALFYHAAHSVDVKERLEY